MTHRLVAEKLKSERVDQVGFEDQTKRLRLPPPDPGHRSQRWRADHKKSQLALIEARSVTRESFSDLLRMGTEEFVSLPFSSPEELLSDRSGRYSEVELLVLNIGAASVTEAPVGERIHHLHRALPNVPLVVLSDREELGCVVGAFRHGARGYIPTTVAPPVAIAALRLVQAGGTFFPTVVLLQAFREQSLAGDEWLNSVRPASFQSFTPRQLEVLRLLQQGKANKVIAYELGVQESTVKVHVGEIMKKLKATNRTHAAFLAHRMCGA